MKHKAPSLFSLLRNQDMHKTSGTGIVLWGVQFPDGQIAVRWNTDTASTVIYDSFEDFLAIHVENHPNGNVINWLNVERPAITEENHPPDEKLEAKHFYVEAPRNQEIKNRSVFLAGGITKIWDWQKEIAKLLENYNVTVLNP